MIIFILYIFGLYLIVNAYHTKDTNFITFVLMGWLLIGCALILKLEYYHRELAKIKYASAIGACSKGDNDECYEYVKELEPNSIEYNSLLTLYENKTGKNLIYVLK